MPFAGGTEAHDNPGVTRGKIRLIGIDNDGWIEKCSRLNRIFHREIRTDQHFLVPGKAVRIGFKSIDHRPHSLIVRFKEIADIPMPRSKNGEGHLPGCVLLHSR